MPAMADLLNEYQAASQSQDYAPANFLKGNFNGGKDAEIQANKGNGGNFFTHLLPTAGAVAGGLIGLPAEALNFIPGLGVAANVGLAGAGAAAGKALENKLEGANDVTQGVGQEALLGGLGQGVGHALGTLPGVFGKLGIQSAKAAPAVTDTTSQVAKTSLAGRAAGTANKLLASQYGAIPAPIARSVGNLPEAFGKLAKAGLTSPTHVESVAQPLIDTVSKAVRGAAGGAGNINISGLRSVAEDLVNTHQVPASEAKTFMNSVDQAMGQLRGGPLGSMEKGSAAQGKAVGVIPTAGNPSDTLGLIKQFQENAANAVRGALPTGADKALARVNNLFADELGSRLDQAGASANLKDVLTPEFRDSLVSLSPGNTKWANYVDNTIMKSPDLASLRSSIAPATKASIAIKAADIGLPTFGSRMAQGGLLKGLLSGMTGSNVGKRAAAGILNTASGVSSTGTQGPIGAVLRPAISQGMVQAAAAANQPQDQGQMDQSTTQPAQPAQTQPTDQTQSEGLGFSPETLQAMAINDIHATGGKNLNNIIALSKIGKTSTLNAAQQKTANDIQDAFSFLDTAEQEIKDLGGAQGPKAELAGIPIVGKYIEPKVAAYNQTRVDLATALAKSLTGSARPAASVIKQFELSLPNPTDSPDQATQKLDNLRRELGNKAQNYGLDPTTGQPTGGQ